MGIFLSVWFYCNVAGPPEDVPYVKINSASVFEAFAVGKPRQTATWKVPPSVRVCTDSGVSVARTRRALSYWEKNGYTFGIVRGDPFSMCMTPKHGEIVVTLPESGFGGEHMASTRLYTDISTGEIVRAKIHMLPKNASKERVLEHEIGHALGWAHYKQRYHIMHPEWRHGGYDSYGIRKR